MFRKENSSCSNAKAIESSPQAKSGQQSRIKKGKKNSGNTNNTAPPKALDTPLRKSDIRQLKQQARDFFLPEDGLLTDDQVRLLASILDQVFVAGSVATRQLFHAELGKLTLFVRTPNSNANSTPNSDFVWPYAISQILWISRPPMPNTQQVTVHVPTLALLSVVPPSILRPVCIPANASQFLCRGAHLMRAGMWNLPPLAAEIPPSTGRSALLLQPPPPPRVVAIAVAGNPQPMAVGVLDDGVRTEADIGPETRGVGAIVWTCYGDDLWRQQALELETVTNPPIATSPHGGASYNDGNYGNVGFLEGERVWPIVEEEEGRQEDGQDEDVVEDQEPANGEAVPEDPSEEDKVPEAEAHDANEDAKTSDSADANQATASISQDDLLHQAVCKTLLTGISAKDLPMTVATFYANHVLPNRPEGTTIQLKQTKYKKFGNYLQEQVERKLITLGPGPNKNNKDQAGFLMDFDKRHSDLLDYKEDHKEEVQQAKEAAQAAEALKQQKLVLVNLFIVPNHLVKNLRLDPDAVQAVQASSKERAGTGMLTAQEVRALLESYLTRENLTDVDQVKLDGPLFDALYKKKKDGEVTNDTLTVSRKDISEEWVAAMNPAYAIVQSPGNKVQKLGQGQPPKVQIEVSMRGSRKFITKIRGMEAYGVNGHVLARDIGHRLACQATVETFSEKGAALAKGCVELVLGGNFADELEALLLGDEKLCPSHGGIKNSDYRLPKGCIDVVLRKGVPARKKGGKKK